MQAEDIAPLFRVLLARLVRIAIGCGITYQAFNRLLRRVYVEVAADYEPVGAKPNTDGRISMLTGLPRRDIRATRALPEDQEPVHRGLDWLVMDRWTSKREYADEHGNLLPLHRTAKRGGDASFEALVASVSAEAWSRTILDEWIRVGRVELDAEDRVVFKRHPSSDDNLSKRAGSVVLTHFVADMLAGFAGQYLEGRKVEGFRTPVLYGQGLTAHSAQLVCEAARREAFDMLMRLNILFLERTAQDAGREDAVHRITVGVGIYEVDERADRGLLASVDEPH